MLNNLKTFHYHKELISSMLKMTMLASTTVNIIAPLFYYFVFKDMIPKPILFTWLIFMFSIFIYRRNIHNRLKTILSLDNQNLIDKFLKLYLLTIFLSAFSWGLASIPALLYADESHVFIYITIILGMLTGSMSTLSGMFHGLVLFILSITIPVILALIFIGDSQVYYYAAILLSIYLPIALPSAFRVFSSLKEAIYQKEKIKKLNESLELKVQKAVQESKQNEKILQDQSRLAQMGEMISMIAHQWRQPLGAISSAVMGIQIKLESGHFDFKKEDDRDKFLMFMDKKHKNISEYVQFLSTTIDDFRNFFKPDKEKEMVSLTIPIERALQIVQTSMSAKGIAINTDYSVNKKLYLYQNEMMQVILNILKNSEDNFIEKQISNPQINISTKKDKGCYIITILDNGGGIPEDILPNIFDPYFSTKSEKNGTGLGLYMSKIMVEEHNNAILSVKNIDNGICFEIILKENSRV